MTSKVDSNPQEQMKETRQGNEKDDVTNSVNTS